MGFYGQKIVEGVLSSRFWGHMFTSHARGLSDEGVGFSPNFGKPESLQTPTETQFPFHFPFSFPFDYPL